MRLRRVCLEIFALRRFFSEPMVAFSITDRAVRMEAFSGRDCKLTSLLEVCMTQDRHVFWAAFVLLRFKRMVKVLLVQPGPPIELVRKKIGLVGFEPTASSSRTRRSTKLSHSPQTGDRSDRRSRVADLFRLF